MSDQDRKYTYGECAKCKDPSTLGVGQNITTTVNCPECGYPGRFRFEEVDPPAKAD